MKVSFKITHKLFLLFVLLAIVGFPIRAFAVDVGVAWVGKSGMSKRVNSGFVDRLKEIAPDIKLEHRMELNDLDALKNTIADYEKTKKAMVILRSNGAKYLGKNPPNLPTFVGGCNDVRVLGAVDNPEAPEGNITGVTYALPYEIQFETFQAVLPNMKKIFLLTEKGHPSGDIDADNTEKLAKKLGLELQALAINSKDEALETVRKHTANVDAFIIGNQAKVFDIAKEIVATAGNTPVLSYSSKPVKDGALGGFVADDNKLGRMLADSLVDVVIHGKTIKSVPIKVDPKPNFYVNVTTAGKLGVDVPFEILETATVIE